MTPVSLTTNDGTTLCAKQFTEVGEHKGTVAIFGAFAVSQRYYRHFARWLADQGYRVLTTDYRGLGESISRPAHQETADCTVWAQQDASAALLWLQEQPGPRFVVGHSFGGQIIGINDAVNDVNGCYLVASQLAHHSLYPGLLNKAGMWLVPRLLLPGVATVFGRIPAWAGLGAEVPAPAALEWSKWLRSEHYLLDHVPGARARFQRFSPPVSLIGFTDDTYAPPLTVAALANALPEKTEVRVVQPADFEQKKIGHFGFFRPHLNDALWTDCLTRLRRFQT